MADGIKFPSIDKVKIEYLKPANYSPAYVTGIIGGVTPKGDIIMNFYTDMSGIPESQYYTVVDGKLGPEIANKRNPPLINRDTVTFYRQVQSGIIMSLPEIKVMMKWLEEQMKIIEGQPKNINTPT